MIARLTPHASALTLAADRGLLTALAGRRPTTSAWAAVPRFALATLALAGLAWVVSFATEQLGERFGPGVTGMLQSTLGNLPELFVVIFALQKGELVVAQTAIVGSILANALLVLGLVIVVGARRSPGRPDALLEAPAQRHRDAAAGDRVHHRAARPLARLARSGQPSRQAISAVGAICLLVVYLAWVVPYLRSDGRRGRGRGAQAREAARRAGAAARRRAAAVARLTLALLIVGGHGLGVRLGLVRQRPGAGDRRSCNISQAFAGLVIVAIAGNAVENTAGLVLAWKGRSDLAISVVKNSVAQIAAFLFPLLVLVSFALATTLTFALAPVYIGALALTALALWQVTGDGEAAEFEGWALVALYVILATLTLYE